MNTIEICTFVLVALPYFLGLIKECKYSYFRNGSAIEKDSEYVYIRYLRDITERLVRLEKHVTSSNTAPVMKTFLVGVKPREEVPLASIL